MKTLLSVCAILLAVVASADEPAKPPPAKETKVFQTDKYGNVQYHQPSWVVRDYGRIVEVSPYGEKLHHKPGLEVEGDKVYQTDQYGNRQKPAYTLEGDMIYRTDEYGNKNEPAYVTKGDKVYATDKYGSRQQPAFELKRAKPQETGGK